MYFADGGDIAPGSIDFAKEAVGLGLTLGVIERRGGWCHYNEQKWQGAERMIEAVREEIDLHDALRADVLSIATSRIG
jgi:hypothetical protein